MEQLNIHQKINMKATFIFLFRRAVRQCIEGGKLKDLNEVMKLILEIAKKYRIAFSVKSFN